MSLEQTIGNLEIRYANVVTFVGTSNTMVDTTTGRIQTKGIQHNSNVITDISGPHGRVAPTLKKYPEIIFEKGKFDRNDTTNTYVQAGYTVSTDSVYNDRQVYRSFDGIDDPAVGFTYSSEDVGGNGFVQASGLPVSGVTFQDENDTSYTGHYIKLELPKKIKLNSVYLSSRNQENNLAAPNDKRPTSGTFLGSNDGTNWTLLRTFNDGELTWSSSTFATNASFHTTNITNIVNDGYFSYIMFLIEKIKTTNAYGVAEITKLEYYGYEEYTPAGDHSVDTTFMSRFNNPQLTGVKVLVDGGMANPGTNQISGGADPSGNNSIYDATNKYYTLNGTLTSNLSVEANTFLEGDQPHAVSMWFNSSNLEANVSNTCVFSISDQEKLDSQNLDLQSNTWHNLTYTYQGEGGSRVTYLDGRKVAEDQAEDTFGKYPPFAMTGASQGGYVVSGSSTQAGVREAWNAFDNNVNLEWRSSGADYTGSDGIYVGTAHRLAATDADGNAIPYGEWLQIKMPNKILLQSIKLVGDAGYLNRTPEDFKLYGSTNGTTWKLLITQTGLTPTTGGDIISPASALSVRYDYYALVTTKLFDAAQTDVAIEALEFYGHRENDLVRLPDPTNVLKYPHILTKNGTGDGFTSPTSAPEYSKRGYVIKASSSIANYPPYAAFNGETHIATGTVWVGGFNSYGTNNSGVSVAGGYKTSGAMNLKTNLGTGGSATSNGEWLYIEMPHKIKVTSTKVVSYDTSPATGHPPDYLIIYGTNDPSSSGGWVVVDDTYASSSSGVPNNATGKTWAVSTASSPVAYKYFAYVLVKVNSSANNSHGIVSNWELYGTEEGSVPIQIGGGNIDKVANFRVYDKFIQQDQALEIWDAQKDYFGRAKSQMVLQQGKLGVGTDAPQGRFSVADEPHNLEEFPPRAMTAYKNYFEGHGEFCASMSSYYPPSYPKPFNKNDALTDYWESVASTYTSTSGGSPAVFTYIPQPATANYYVVAVGAGGGLPDRWCFYSLSQTHGVDACSAWTSAYVVTVGSAARGPTAAEISTSSYRWVYSASNHASDMVDLGHKETNDTTSVSERLASNTPRGQFVTLKLPYKICLKSYEFAGPGTKSPKEGQIWGSTNGTTWSHIHTFTGGVADVKNNETVSGNTNYYSYYAFITTKITGADTAVRIIEWRLFGTREQGQSVLHDGQLTLTKSLNVPRIGPALDADDTPRRDRLVVEYNTSTNPTFEGAVRDTSGRGNDGMFYGGANYSASEKALKFDGSGDYVEGSIHNSAGEWLHSVSMWFKQNTADSYDVLFHLGDQSSGKAISMRRFSSGEFRYNFYDANTEASPATTLGTWYHLAFTYSGGTAIANRKIYLNGVELTVVNSSGTPVVLNLNANEKFTLATQSQPIEGQMNCDISNFKLYDTALTAEEVKTLYDMGRCDEGHHVVNFSKTRVGIGLGDGEAPRGALDVRGETPFIGPGLVIHQAASGNWGTEGDPANMNGLLLTLAGETGLTTGSGYWNIAAQVAGSGSLLFAHRGKQTAYIQASNSNNPLDFTGQHRTFIKDVPFSQAGDLEGLIVSSDQNKYIKISGGIETGSNAIMINESLPVVSLSNIVTDKKCFGVISASEDPEQRSDAYGSFVTPFDKEKGDTRVYINSVGEGAIWVSNIGGSLDAGDYITTSNVAGYGQKQDSDSLKNYTVAKITMDCDFNPATQPIQQILRSNVIQTYYLGDVHHMKNVPHEFVTTTVGVDDTWSNVSIDPSNVAYAEWSNLEANTQNTYTLTYTQTSNVVYDTKYTLTTTANVTESDAWDRVSIDPPSVTYAQYSNLEANTQSSYSLTFTKTTTDTKTPGAWSALESNTQSLYNEDYYQSVEEEVASDYTGATTHTRVTDVIENELDVHGQIQWEDHSTETEKAYKIRYLDVSGTQTDSANAVHIAAFVGCTYHCG